MHALAGWVLFVTVALIGSIGPALADDGFVILHGSTTFRPGGAFPTTTGTTHGPAFGSWSGSDANTGTLISDPFAAPLAVEFELSGYPSHPGEGITLERLDHTDLYALALRDPREAWRPVQVELPLAWYGKPVRLVARDAGTGYAAWEGISDLRPLRVRQSIVAGDRMKPVTTLVVLFVFWLLPGIVIAALLAERLGADPRAAFPIAFLSVSALGLLTFFLSLQNPLLGSAFAWVVLIAAVAACVSPLRTAIFQLCSNPDLYWPLALVLSASLFSTALLEASGGEGSLVFAAQTRLNGIMPPDNILPGLLADRVAQHLPARPFFGDWLSSDRPPLQAGLDLFARTLYPAGSYDAPRYEAISSVAQCSVLAIVFGLARVAGASIRRSVYVTAMVACSGFFLVNALFVWPKLLAAALSGSGIILYTVLRYPRVRYVAAGAAFGLGMMAHGGIAFTLPILALVALLRERRVALVPLTWGLATMLLIMAPWSAYAHFIDPPGDRLLKWHLAGHIPVDAMPLGQALREGYTKVPLATILANKIANVKIVLGLDDGKRGQREFFQTLPALDWLPLGALGLLFAALRGRRIWLEPDVGYLAIGGVALVLWCLLMYGPATTSVHQGSYLTQILLMSGLALAASRFAPLAAVVAALGVWEFWSLHVAPKIVFSHVPFSAVAGLLIGMLVLVVAASSHTYARLRLPGMMRPGPLVAESRP